MRKISFWLAIILFLFGVTSATAQEYPTNPITLLVGFSAGGSTDLSGRKLAELVKKYINNQPVVVENKTGGAGTVGAVVLSQAKPDGYTIGVVGATAMVLTPHMRKVPYDPRKDFEYIMQYAEYPEIFCVRKDHPANSWKEWIEWAKKNVNKASYTTSGPGSAQHIFMQEIFSLEKISPSHIPFGGGSEAVVKVLGGHINAILAAETVPHIKSGELKPFAVMNAERLPFIPQVPSFRELGYTEVRAPLWLGLAAPGKTPTPIIKKLEEAFTQAAKEPAFLEMMKNIEMPHTLRDSTTLRKTVEADYNYYGPFLKSQGVHAR